MKKKSTEEDPLDEFRYPDGMYDIPTIVSFFGRKRHQKHTFEEIHKEVCDLLEIECAFKHPYLRKPLLKQQAQQPSENPLLISVFALQLLLIAILLWFFVYYHVLSLYLIYIRYEKKKTSKT